MKKPTAERSSEAPERRNSTHARQLSDDLLIEAMQGSMVPVGTGTRLPATPQPKQAGIIGRLFENREDRRHREALKATANTAEEVIFGLSAESTIANATVAAGLETERGYEEVIMANRDSAMALKAAPTYVQIARTNFTAGVSALVSAGISNIVKKINDR